MENLELVSTSCKTGDLAAGPPGKTLQASRAHTESSVSSLFFALCSGLPVHQQLPEFTQTHVHPVGDAIQPSVVPFSSCPKSLPASGSFPVSQLFSTGGQSIGASASASVLLMNIQLKKYSNT